MRDEEIIKALECCKNGCKSRCPRMYSCDTVLECKAELMEYSLDLINSQQAEIERLDKEIQVTRSYIHDNGLEWDLLSYFKRNGG